MTQDTADLDVVGHIRIFEVPARLTAEQRAGEVCVWCSTPLPPGVPRIGLGGSLDWSPHGCTACYEAHRAWVEAYGGWASHMRGCWLCANAARCDVADGYRVQLLDAVQRTGKPPVACAQCHQEVRPSERFEPLPWEGNSAPRFDYTHIAMCVLPRYCQSCGLLIQAGEEFTTYEHQSASAGGTTVYLHVEPCRKAPALDRL
uniref:Uncharacterized protein n=1 Tax=Streptomyces sp. NBC_00093 TaxID=2975649 RepID=A0AAU2A0L9_9ACTN